jgi:hypothetical protein
MEMRKESINKLTINPNASHQPPWGHFPQFSGAENNSFYCLSAAACSNQKFYPLLY